MKTLTIFLLLSAIMACCSAKYDKVYDLLISKCLRAGKRYKYEYPVDAEAHYADLMNKTAKYRVLPPHGAVENITKPWIENHFVNHFSAKPLSYFNGMIPIFIQWIDQYVYHMQHINDKVLEVNLFAEVRSWLRPTVLYVTVSQTNHGLRFFNKLFPNVIVMSAGGEGNIALPLLKQTELPYQPLTNEWQYDVAFFGTVEHGVVRQRALNNVKEIAEKMKLRYTMGPSKTWAKEMSKTIFNFAPRGFGRNTFRFTEIVQLGRIPVYVYDDFAWIPYAGTDISIEQFGYVSRVGNEHKLMKELMTTDNATVTQKLALVKAAREFYTFAGIVKQMELFFQDPLGPAGGQLSCTPIMLHGDLSLLDHQLR